MCENLPLAAINGRATELARLMAADHRLAFEPWETELLSRIALEQPGNFVALSEDGADLVAGVIAGRCGKRGTISHAWVAPALRGGKIGDRLALDATKALAKAGASVIHLMVTGDNQPALKFWQRIGFVPVADRLTLECDIPALSMPERSFEQVSYDELSELAKGDHEREAELALLLDHHAAIFVARGADGIEGFIAVGSLGVRGLIECSWAISPELEAQLVERAFCWLAENGVRRAHAFVPSNDPSLLVYRDCGMKHDPTETTLEFVPVRCAVA